MSSVATVFDKSLDGRAAAAGSSSVPARAAVSWSAILAGAFVAAGVSLILLALGSGLGFAATSPWADHGVTATTFAVTAAIWVVVTQWISAGMGGYIAGRLRTRWMGTHVHEVFFRDTAHGLVTWAVATVLVAAVTASSLTAAIGGGMHMLSAAAGGAAAGGVARGAAGPASGDGYELDRLFRPMAGTVTAATVGGAAAGAAPATGQAAAGAGDPRVEAAHIAMHSVATGSLSDSDRGFLAALVAQKTGISEPEAQKRVDDFASGALEAEAKAKAEADAARQAAAETSLYLALSLLIGAFIASVAAVLGGHQRDLHV